MQHWCSVSDDTATKCPIAQVATLAKSTTATIRRKLITVPARVASSARRVTLYLPAAWPWEHAWTELFTRACRPPLAPAT